MHQSNATLWVSWMPCLLIPSDAVGLSFPNRTSLKKIGVAGKHLAHAWLGEKVVQACCLLLTWEADISNSSSFGFQNLAHRADFLFRQGSLNRVLFIYTPSLLLCSSTETVRVSSSYFCLLMFVASEGVRARFARLSWGARVCAEPAAGTAGSVSSTALCWRDAAVLRCTARALCCLSEGVGTLFVSQS